MFFYLSYSVPFYPFQSCSNLWAREHTEVRTSRRKWAGAMASEKLVNLQEEVTCPICLELLTEPLSLDCGHSFCQICITTNSKESVTGQKGARKCPVCRINYESGKLRPNWHLANIVQRIREVKLSLQEQEKHLCAHHGEKLLLFCEEDGKVICWLCELFQVTTYSSWRRLSKSTR